MPVADLYDLFCRYLAQRRPSVVLDVGMRQQGQSPGIPTTPVRKLGYDRRLFLMAFRQREDFEAGRCHADRVLELG